MNTEEPHDDYGKLTHQQQHFCDEYLSHFNAFKAAVNSGYSENTSRKGALLHVPKIQQYLKAAMNRRSQRLEITHDMILRELSKIAFSNMGNYYDEYACLKRMSELTVDEKAAISYYDIVEIQDAEGYRVGTQSRIKLHNKMSALDKIARHLNFYGLQSSKPKAESEKQENESSKFKAESEKQDVAVVDRGTNNLPMDYPVEDFELEGVDLKTQMALEGVDVSPGAPEYQVASIEYQDEETERYQVASIKYQEEENELLLDDESIENILTIPPLRGSPSDLVKKNQEPRIKSQDLLGGDGVREFALRMAADTGPVHRTPSERLRPVQYERTAWATGNALVKFKS